jgi:hypothetical protein
MLRRSKRNMESEMQQQQQPDQSPSAKKPRASSLIEHARCSICMELMWDRAVLSCGHGYCMDCLRASLAKRAVCPTCNAPQTLTDETSLPKPDVLFRDMVNEAIEACGDATLQQEWDAVQRKRKVLTLPDGAHYEGPVDAQNRPHGNKGTCTWQDKPGRRYCGEWRAGHITGQGKMWFEDSSVYEGCWDNSEACGQGVLIKSDGSTHVGMFAHGVADGPGVFTDSPVTHKCEATWKEGKVQGRGKVTYHNHGPIFEGDLDENGTPCGQVAVSWPNTGITYVGSWARDGANGQGTMTWGAGASYKGAWVKGKRHGEGIECFADGSSYQGSWDTNRRHGTGTFDSGIPGGVKYTGRWFWDRFLPIPTTWQPPLPGFS